MASQPVRQPAVAGLFYPADPRALAGQVQSLLAQSPLADDQTPPKALIVPHAGYMYSGSTAAAAFNLLAPLRETIRRVVLIGPSHRVALQGAALPRAHAFATPLGSLEIDTVKAFELAGRPGIVVDDRAHAEEHALEVLLPFLQLVLEDFSILPLVVGNMPAPDLGDLLDLVWGGLETLLIVSSDLSHYHRYEDAQAMDTQSTGQILAQRPELTPEQACGAVCINGLLHALQKHPCTARLLALRNSGDTAGDRNRVVGYTAMSFIPASTRTH